MRLHAQVTAVVIFLATMCIAVPVALHVRRSLWKSQTCHTPPSPGTLVHQIWIHDDWSVAEGLDALPAKYHEPVRSWRRRYGANHRLYDKASCRAAVREHFPFLLTTYDRMDSNVERADMARYAVMWAYGGFYTDMDTTMLRPIDEFVDGVAFHTSVEYVKPNAPDGLVQYAFGSPPRHPILSDILEEIARRARDVKRRDMRPDERVFWTTGPVVFSKVVHHHLAMDPTLAVVHRFGTFGAYKHTPPHAYIWHHFDGSWKENWSSEYTYW